MNLPTTLSEIDALLAHITIPANMISCHRCDGTGRYRTHGKCYTCRGSKRVLNRECGALARKLRERRGTLLGDRSERIARENADALARYDVTMDGVLYCQRQGVQEAWDLRGRLDNKEPLTAADHAFLSRIGGPAF